MISSWHPHVSISPKLVTEVQYIELDLFSNINMQNVLANIHLSTFGVIQGQLEDLLTWLLVEAKVPRENLHKDK